MAKTGPEVMQDVLDGLDQTLKGQRQINGKLCQVDWRLVEALKEVSKALHATASGQPADLTRLDQLIAEVGPMNLAVAGVDPPGCDPKNAGTGT